MTNWFVFVILVLACYRLAQFVAFDDAPFGLMLKLRQYFGKRASKNGQYSLFWSLAELVNCPFCVGIWIAFPLTFMLFPSNLLYFLLYWLAIAGGQAFLESINGER